ncbi:hypothetical protein PQE70_gp219 [Bacillus phage vB_BanS_Nate]|uniref:Uncharacterized protein n=1 Tax=Bacillus phage vB_BanS_Nate TaxID=2894788 RepID=A0AAE8YYA1_9CAUD|nr:hypothetical protein PQE70_gp219 [Bacillus phage vB_BanS_Nate]UGO51072.1 hypothetical protein NATE_219 [Bacillus phage vB_BanS_Nate]
MAKANNKVKNLKFTDLKKHDKNLDAKGETFITLDGIVYKIEYDEHFRASKKNKVLDDLIKFFEAGYKDERLYSIATPYTSLLLVKHFTSLDIPDDIEEALAHLHVLIDLGVLETILTALPEDEILNLYEKLTETVNQITGSMMEATSEAKQLANVVENPEVKAWVEDIAKPIKE